MKSSYFFRPQKESYFPQNFSLRQKEIVPYYGQNCQPRYFAKTADFKQRLTLKMDELRGKNTGLFIQKCRFLTVENEYTLFLPDPFKIVARKNTAVLLNVQVSGVDKFSNVKIRKFAQLRYY